MKQYFYIGDLTVNGIDDRWFSPFSKGTPSNINVDARVESLVGAHGTFRNLKVAYSAAPGTGESITLTLYKNGTATALAVTVSNTATAGTNTSDSVTVVPGDNVVFRTNTTGFFSNPALDCSIEFESTEPNQNFLATTFANPANGSPGYFGFLSSANINGSTVYFCRSMVVPHTTTIKGVFYGKAIVTGTNAAQFSVFKNGAEEASSSLTLNSTTTLSGATGLSISLSPGDTIAVRSLSSGTINSANALKATILLESTTDGEFIISSGHYNAALSNVTVRHLRPDVSPGEGPQVIAGNADIVTNIGGISIKNLYVNSTRPPSGSGTYDFLLMKSTTAQSVIAKMGSTATTAIDTTNSASFSEGDLMSLRAFPSSTPTSLGTVYYSMTGYVAGAAVTDGPTFGIMRPNIYFWGT